MSNRRRPTSAAAHRGRSVPGRGVPVTRVKTPGDVVTIVPYLLGFYPADSVVIVALEGARQRFGPCARLDLVDPADLHDAPGRTAAYLAALADLHGFDPVILIAYSDRPEAADPVMAAVLDRLGDDGVTIHDALRADGRRWWSYLCSGGCCPSSGVPYDAQSSEVAAEAVLAGLTRAPDRDSLRLQFAPDPRRQATFVAASESSPPETLDVDALRERVRTGLPDPAALTPREEVVLVRAVQDVQKRDAAWAMMTRETAAEHYAFWLHLLVACPDELMAAVGGLTGFAAWLSGRGVLASHAAERVLDVHPGYSMAVLLLDTCEASLDPSVWDRLRERLA